MVSYSPRTLNKREDPPKDVPHDMLLYVGRHRGDGPTTWGNPYLVSQKLTEEDVEIFPEAVRPRWLKYGATLNRAQSIALYALRLSYLLQSGDRRLRDLCATGQQGLTPYWPVCWCSPRLCHGDLLLVCATGFASMVNSGVSEALATEMVEEALLDMDYSKPGWLAKNLKAALGEAIMNIRSYELTERTPTPTLVLQRAVLETLRTIRAHGGTWNHHRIKRLCTDRIIEVIGLHGRRTHPQWKVKRLPLGLSMEISQPFLDTALEVVLSELDHYARRGAGDTLWIVID